MLFRIAMVVAACLSSCVIGCGRESSVDRITVADSGPIEQLPPPAFDTSDWPWWRGPTRDGVAPAGSAPLRWSETENIVWKAEVPGRGHASPTVVGNRIFLPTADEQAEIQSVLCYDRATGELLWKTDVHRGHFERNVHGENTHASGTAACDGERVFVAFLNDRAVWLTALDLDGKQLWQTKLGPFESRHGFGTSPVIFGSLVIVAADHEGGGYLAAVHRKTGKIHWRTPRPAIANFATPGLVDVEGKPQLVLNGCSLVAAYDPTTGEELWSVRGTTDSTVGTVVSDGNLVVGAGGWPDPGIVCVRADDQGSIVWQDRTKVYIPSLLAYAGHIYAVNDDGRGYCWEAATGRLRWRARFPGSYRASPVLADGRIYVVNRNGLTTVFEPSPVEKTVLAENQLGDEAYATPAICRGHIYMRVARRDSGRRQEYLYCIGTAGETTAQRD